MMMQVREFGIYMELGKPFGVYELASGKPFVTINGKYNHVIEKSAYTTRHAEALKLEKLLCKARYEFETAKLYDTVSFMSKSLKSKYTNLAQEFDVALANFDKYIKEKDDR